MPTTTRAPRITTGDLAINAALAAGFEITKHAALADRYWHQLDHPDGRMLYINTALQNGRLLSAQGYNRSRWNTRVLAARSVPALRRTLAA